MLKVEEIGTSKTFKLDVIEIGTSVRLLTLNHYSTYTEAIEYFGLTDKAIPTSESLKEIGIPYRLERIPKRWQLTEYIVRGYALHEHDDVLMCWVESVDGQSNLIVSFDGIEKIEEYNDINSY
jgi:hypothetical protein